MKISTLVKIYRRQADFVERKGQIVLQAGIYESSLGAL
jgi:hypothetical protein